ncbi:MAG: hypothetical protein SFV18_03115 [Bryobacteraceae bacterium]|nr:hypothetical protein [Bryobacteraceae bacterium]
MTYAILAGGAGFAVLAAVLFSLYRSIAAPAGQGGDDDRPALAELSVAKYQPMLRLLDQDDLSFLREQPGYRPGMERRFFAQRRSVMRGYLRSMAVDFNRLHALATDMLLAAPSDQPELARVLFESKMQFTKGLMLAHFTLALNSLGLSNVSLDVVTGAFSKLEMETTRVSHAFALN